MRRLTVPERLRAVLIANDVRKVDATLGEPGGVEYEGVDLNHRPPGYEPGELACLLHPRACIITDAPSRGKVHPISVATRAAKP